MDRFRSMLTFLACIFVVQQFAISQESAPESKESNSIIEALLKTAQGPTNETNGPTLLARLAAIDAIGQFGKTSGNAVEGLRVMLTSIFNEYAGQKKQLDGVNKKATDDLAAANELKTELNAAKSDEQTMARAAIAAAAVAKSASEDAQESILEAEERATESERAAKDAARDADQAEQAVAAINVDPDTLELAKAATKKATDTAKEARKKAEDSIRAANFAKSRSDRAAEKLNAENDASDAWIAAIGRVAELSINAHNKQALAEASEKAASTAKATFKNVTTEPERLLVVTHILGALGRLGKKSQPAISVIAQMTSVSPTLTPSINVTLNAIHDDIKATPDLATKIDDLGKKVDGFSSLGTKIDALIDAVKKLGPKP